MGEGPHVVVHVKDVVVAVKHDRRQLRADLQPRKHARVHRVDVLRQLHLHPHALEQPREVLRPRKHVLVQVGVAADGAEADKVAQAREQLLLDARLRVLLDLERPPPRDGALQLEVLAAGCGGRRRVGACMCVRGYGCCGRGGRWLRAPFRHRTALKVTCVVR